MGLRGATFKLDQGVINRPHINIQIGNNKRALVTPALVDTGASISVINKELAQQICTKEGRLYLLTKTHATVTSATGHGLQICGTLEAKVSGIGTVSFHVVQGLSNHSCIIGWDELQKHGFQLNKSEIRWGNTVFQLDSYTKQGIAEIHHTPHSPNLQKVIEKYKAVFGKPNQLQQAQVPPMEIKTTGYPIHQRTYRTPLAKREALNKEADYTVENRLAIQSEVFQAAARATKDSRKYNKARLEARATAKDNKVGDHVLLKANEPLSLTAKWDFGYVVSKVNGLVVELMHPETGAVIQTHREKIVLTDPDMALDEISPRPRRQRQKVTQVHIPKRRDYIPRSRRNSVSSTVSQGSVRFASTVKSAATAPVKRQDTVFARPTALPPFSQNRLPKRPREDSYSEDFIAKRTHAQRQKRALEEDGVEEPEPKRWRSEQLSLLQFVSDYFLNHMQ